MSEVNIYAALSSLLSIGGLLYLSFCYRRLRVDAFRQEMFILRDRLFIEAAEGVIPFGHPAYGLLRQTMNGYIRFGHDLSLMHMFISRSFFYVRVPESATFEKKWSQATRDLPGPAKEKLAAYREQMIIIVVSHILFGSTLAVLLSAAMLAVIALIEAVKFVSMRNPLKPLKAALRSVALSKLQPQIAGINNMAEVVGQ
jgi:hypothetical protein